MKANFVGLTDKLDLRNWNISCHIGGLPGGSDSKESACNAGGPGSILG